MKTPSIWSKNLKELYISEDMLDAALYSVNKRAKNCRDQKRKYRGSMYGTDEKYQDKESEYYKKKEELLSYLQPVCVHREIFGYQKIRHYDYEKNFDDILMRCLCDGTICWSNSYVERNYDDYYDFDQYDYDLQEQNRVYFFDELLPNQPNINYYAYYVIGTHTYHSPIEKEKAEAMNIPIVDIGQIKTMGHDITDLCSVSFVNKVLDVLKQDECKIQKSASREYWLDDFYPSDYPQKKGLSDEEIDSNIDGALNFWGKYLSNVVKKRIEKSVNKINVNNLTTKQLEEKQCIYSKEIERYQKQLENKRKDLNNAFRNLEQIITNEAFTNKSLKKIKKRLKKLKNKLDRKNIQPPDLEGYGDDLISPMLEVMDEKVSFLSASYKNVDEFIEAWKEIHEENYDGNLSLMQEYKIKKQIYEEEAMTIQTNYLKDFYERYEKIAKTVASFNSKEQNNIVDVKKDSAN